MPPRVCDSSGTYTRLGGGGGGQAGKYGVHSRELLMVF